MIRAVLFDFGGVLAATGKQGYINNVVASILGLPEHAIDIQDLHSDLRRGKATHQEFFTAVNRRYGGTKRLTAAAFLAKTRQIILNHDVLAMAADLRERGLTTGILSNVFSINANELRKRGLYDGFNPVLLSCELGYAKPDPEIYDLAIQQVGLRPEEILFIDDQEKCLAPARAKGMHVVRAASPEQTIADTVALLSL